MNLCHDCNKRPATFHWTLVNEDGLRKIDLCAPCADKPLPDRLHELASTVRETAKLIDLLRVILADMPKVK